MASANGATTPTNVIPCKVIVLGDGGVGKTCMLHSYTNGFEFLGDKQQYIRTVFENYHAAIDIEDASSAAQVEGRGGAQQQRDAAKTVMHLSLWDTAGQEQYDQLRSMCYQRTCIRDLTPTSLSKQPSEQLVNVVTLTPRFVSASFDVAVFVLCFSWNDPASLTNIEMKWYKELKRVAAAVEAERAASDDVSTSSDGSGGRNKRGGKQPPPGYSQHSAAVLSGSGSAAHHRPFVVILCATKSDLKAEALRSEAPSPNRGGQRGGLVSYEDVDRVVGRIRADAFVECSAKTGDGVKEVMDVAMRCWFQRIQDDMPDPAGARSFLCSMM